MNRVSPRHIYLTLKFLTDSTPVNSSNSRGFSKPIFSFKSIYRQSCRAYNTMDNTFLLKGSPHFENLFTEPFKQLVSIFDRHGYEIRIAGGAVRDLISGNTPHDIDLATTATPSEMRQIFESENIRMFNELGEKHGTVSVRMLEKENYEITTLRIDKVTDGRRAEVEFTRDWRIDAERRDLTINSMFLGLDGTLYDYFNGREDLENRKICFVGSPVARIQEDYLRILRYFRFYGRIALEEDQHDQETLNAIRENVQGMSIISGERIWSEWKKILSGNFGGPLTLKIIDVGLTKFIGLPDNPNVQRMEQVWQSKAEIKSTLHPVTLLSTLLDTEDDFKQLHARLKFSGFERDLGIFAISHRGKLDSVEACKNALIDTKFKLQDCQQWLQEVLKLDNHLEIHEEISSWVIPAFPVGGSDLKEAGFPPNKLFSLILHEMKEIWKKSDFKLSKEELMAELPLIVENIKINRPASPKSKKAKITK